jgi:peptide chain release factor 2
LPISWPKCRVLWGSWGGFFDVGAKRDRLKILETEALKPELWNDPTGAQKTLRESTALKNTLLRFDKLEKSLGDLVALEELCREMGGDSEWKELSEGVTALQMAIGDMTFRAKLSGPMDAKNAIVSLHAGAGGTESCDWTEMLYRMYTRWAERNGCTVEVTNLMPGDGAGYKRAEFLVSGEFAYGNLKSEIGVHRLVRISPFDSNARRHTSFAACDVIPEIDDDIPIDIKEADLKVDTFKSGGAGGQHVNKTESAVRFTHIPTGIIVSSQVERSQHKNRAMCLKLLKAKLYDQQLEKQRAVTEKHYDDKGDIAWGHQIRSYVFMPYQLVKDTRSGYESSQIQAIMDGDLNPFIHAYLEWKLSGALPRRTALES